MNQNETVFGEFPAHEQPTATSRLLRPPTRSQTNPRGFRLQTLIEAGRARVL